MRPVNKGDDLGEFNPYQNAQQPLSDLIGEYCSYCERWVCSGIHIEHKKPKGEYPEFEYSWDNFLLACTNCNSSKGKARLDLDDYVWPDKDNTLRAFLYIEEGVITPNEVYPLPLNEKIKNTWELLGLNRHPNTYAYNGTQKPTNKDKRWVHRRDEWLKATDKKASLLKSDSNERRIDLVDLALQRGMFSIWYSVFYDDIDMRKRLVGAFKGTETSCFDGTYQLIARNNGVI